MLAGGQDLDLHHIVLQLLLTLGLDHFGGSQVPRLLVLGLHSRDTRSTRQACSAGNRPLDASAERPWGVDTEAGVQLGDGGLTRGGGAPSLTMARAPSMCEKQHSTLNDTKCILKAGHV